MQRFHPFSRYHAIRAAIAAAIGIADISARIDALRAIPEYRSRGKGWKGKKKLATSNPARYCNNAKVKPGKQGARECARRVRQGLSFGPSIVWQNGVVLS